ncbi:hypothetical protein OHB07_10810 [Streptomyces sp. NBC_00111]|uniref:hypothetical protein n=1 Tax=Streptomyces sp. NBC_00111 TaxID=2975655 RepID=UPI00324E5E58
MPYPVRERSAPETPPEAGGAAPGPDDGFLLQHRPLTRPEAAGIMREIRKSPDITGYSEGEWTGRRDTFALMDTGTGRLAGALLVHHLAGRWSEMAVVFLFEEYRGRGLGPRMLQGAIRALEPADRDLLLFFCSSGMGRIAGESGFDVLAGEAEFTRGSLRRTLFLSVLYKAQWLCNAYRLREIRRKKREFQCSFAFKVAVMTREGAR